MVFQHDHDSLTDELICPEPFDSTVFRSGQVLGKGREPSANREGHLSQAPRFNSAPLGTRPPTPLRSTQDMPIDSMLLRSGQAFSNENRGYIEILRSFEM